MHTIRNSRYTRRGFRLSLAGIARTIRLPRQLSLFEMAALVVVSGFVTLPAWAGANEPVGVVAPLAQSAHETDHEARVFGKRLRKGRPLHSFPQVSCGTADLTGVKAAVFVSPEGSDNAGCGTSLGSPCKTIQQGINNCSDAGCGVLVRYGRYPVSATLNLRDGVNVYGGCEFGSGPSTPYRTVVQAPPGGAPALSADQINTTTMLYGFTVFGSDATTPGGASIAMTVSNSKSLTLSHTILASGKGGDGAAGITPQAGAGANGFGSTNTQSGAGQQGGPSCVPNSSQGSGGQGGDGLRGDTNACFFTCACLYPNQNDALGRQGQASGPVTGGGGGGRAFGGDYCTYPALGGDFNGKNGFPGSPGQCSTQGGAPTSDTIGTFNGTNWMPGLAGQGGGGSVGSGGGGGSSGGFCVGFPDNIHAKFAQGVEAGGGGAGGCGGIGGQGGQQGGASIPLVLLNSSVGVADINEYVLIPGPGGRGGTGGKGGTGGAGGQGGPGGPGGGTRVGSYNCPGPSGAGGAGGQGGAGSGGAGGNGGPSFGIALVGNSPAPPNGNRIYNGQPGGPGSRGAGGQNDPSQCIGAAGADGVTGGTAPWHSF